MARDIHCSVPIEDGNTIHTMSAGAQNIPSRQGQPRKRGPVPVPHYLKFASSPANNVRQQRSLAVLAVQFPPRSGSTNKNSFGDEGERPPSGADGGRVDLAGSMFPSEMQSYPPRRRSLLNPSPSDNCDARSAAGGVPDGWERMSAEAVPLHKAHQEQASFCLAYTMGPVPRA